jgi:hypothetical protein
MKNWREIYISLYQQQTEKLAAKMKTVKMLAAVAVLAMAGWACNTTDSETAREGVTFQTTQSSYISGDTVTAVLQNNSSHQVVYGNPFQVLQKVYGRWKYIGPSLYFTLEAYTMKPGGQTTYRFDLTDSLFSDHAFSGGQYRVSTSVEIGENDYTEKTYPFRVRSNPQQ